MRLLLGLSVMAVGLAGCGDRNFGFVRTTTTEADTRVVMAAVPQRPPENGRPVVPNQIFCAEPSPDVAKAVSSASQAAASLEVNATEPQTGTAVAAAGTVAAGRSRAEALAQLAERLATIQLLRDGLYRACEAFANGAVGPISYALMLSRYGDTMVTLLGSEMAAGAFGRQMAALGTSADGSSQSSLVQARQAAEQVTATETRIRELETERARVVDDIAVQAGLMSSENETTKSQATEKKQQQERRLQQIDAEVASLRARLRTDQAAQALTAARAQTLVPGGGLTEAQRRPDAGPVLERMQDRYMQTGDLSAMTLACITALQQSTEPVVGPGGPRVIGYQTELARLCGEGRLLQMLVEANIAAGRARMALQGSQPPGGQRRP
ncbi:hypothetical protein [Falsiroseomonas ponticola]|uniref:hypothetical protein n=1 Tax=Falsiroseomonas ponticola TaxID=2786951 RepID=UPI001933F18C|nr:hypothetical protein [Roseomonas ponticola]